MLHGYHLHPIWAGKENDSEWPPKYPTQGVLRIPRHWPIGSRQQGQRFRAARQPIHNLLSPNSRRTSDTVIRNSKSREKRYKLSGGGGLVPIINPNGSRWWRLSYCYGGREKMLSLPTAGFLR